MGRLGRHRLQKQQLKRLLRTWALPVLASVLILGYFQVRVQAQTPPSGDELAVYLQDHELGVSAQITDGLQQIFYTYNGDQIQITNSQYNHVNPMSSGSYVAWEEIINGYTQIFLYNVLDKSLVQVTSLGNNESLFLKGKTLTWQGWVDDRWEIYYFDGFTVKKISDTANPCTNASTDGLRIIYTEQLGTDSWKAQLYDIPTGQTSVIREGDTASTAYPRFDANGDIRTDFVAH